MTASVPAPTASVAAVPSPTLDVDGMLADRATRVIVLCGSGGVGKTTTAAALAVRAAEQGRRVCVLTIDPALRLAQSLGLDHLDNTPRPSAGVGVPAGGSLDAMMLDMKRTFDEIVVAHADAERARTILENPFYQAMSTSFSGTQEYMAMEKLGQLMTEAETSGRWDLIVVDTPPSRSALDFIDAPEHLASFLDGRSIKLLTAPLRLGHRTHLRFFRAPMRPLSGILERLLGAQILTDLQLLVTAFDVLLGGFRERAARTAALLRAESSLFLVVAGPEPDALREASFFTKRLAEAQIPFGGLVLNRMHASSAATLSVERSLSGAEELARHPEHGLTERLLRIHAERMQRIRYEQHLAARYSAAFPDVPVAVATALPSDVHDLGGLRAVGESLAARTPIPTDPRKQLDPSPRRT